MTMTIKIKRLHHRNDPATAKAAAASQKRYLSNLQAIVLDMVRIAGPVGLTDSELNDDYAADYLHMGWVKMRFDTPRKRRSDLTRDGLLVDSGKTRSNQYGRHEVVWVLA